MSYNLKDDYLQNRSRNIKRIHTFELNKHTILQQELKNILQTIKGIVKKTSYPSNQRRKGNSFICRSIIKLY